MVGSTPMPQYRSHKLVGALQIDRVEGEVVHFVEEGYPPMRARDGMFVRYTPVPGDYWVRYADGYESISPCEAFREGYTRV
jgi:hypothetical protein